MSLFYPLKVKKITRQTSDSVSIELETPQDNPSLFAYKQGQYLTFKIMDKGQEIRRSYSICSSPYNGEGLKVAVKEVTNGTFSAFVNRSLKEGDVLETMAPAGNFYTELKATNAKKYVGFAAGSGITPVISIMKSVLQVEPNSRFHLIYGNKDENSVIFKNDIAELQAKYPDKLQVTYVYSRQTSDDKLFEGRIDAAKCKDLVKQYNLTQNDEFFICGPEEMIIAVSDELKACNVDKAKVHFELFTTPVKLRSNDTTADFSGTASVTVIMNGDETTFDLAGTGLSVLDAAIEAGVDAPFSCKGAVCCTCRAKILEGNAKMVMNYALSDDEVNSGFILTCQAHPLTEKLVVDFDVL